MRGSDVPQTTMFRHSSVEDRIPADTERLHRHARIFSNLLVFEWHSTDVLDIIVIAHNQEQVGGTESG